MNKTRSKGEYISAVYSRIIRLLSESDESDSKITLRKLHMLAYLCNAYIMATTDPKWTIPFRLESNEVSSNVVHERIRLMYNCDYERFANNYNFDDLMTDEEIKAIDTIVGKMGHLDTSLLNRIIKKDTFKGEDTPVGKIMAKQNYHTLDIIETEATKEYYNSRFWNSILSPGVLEELKVKQKNKEN